MTTRDRMNKFFAEHGSLYTIEESRKEYYGILSPKSRTSEGFQQKSRHQLGQGVDGDYLLMTDANASTLMKGAHIHCRAGCFLVISAEEYSISDKPVYRFAVLRRRAENGACLS